MYCRHCKSQLETEFLDLGFSPFSNSYLSLDDLKSPEIYFPLKLFVCENCWLVQTEDHAKEHDLFRPDYAYFSSISSGWVAHAVRYTEMIIPLLNLGKNSHVIEIGSNDGYLLKNFLQRGIPCLGIEPTDSTATAAEKLGIPVIREFFGKSVAERLVEEGKNADLIIANNVFAHVPDINDFTLGLKLILSEHGSFTLEFPHVMRLIEHTQFDTVYHEHFSYYSLYTVLKILQRAQLRVYHVEELPTHGGSLRIYGCHEDSQRGTNSSIEEVLRTEARFGLQKRATYLNFQGQANRLKNELLEFLLIQKRNNKLVVGYGAAAKGNTLLNYAGVKPDLLPFISDAAPSKQGKYLPGTHIPVLAPADLLSARPDYVLILPWNIADEVMREQACLRTWGGKFVRAVPNLTIM
jgi:hypothetical protein